MTISAGAYKIIEPSFKEPEFFVQFQQASGYVDLLEGSKIRNRLGEDDLVVYFKQLNIRTKIAGSQAAANQLPGVDIAASMFSTATYQFRVRSEYDYHDVAAGSRWGFAVPQAYQLGMRQAHFQNARDGALFGFQPQNGEGFLNSPNSTLINLPPDQFGNTTATTYDNGQIAFFFAQTIASIKQRTLQLGIGHRIAILGPQRTLLLWEYNIVQLTAFQRPGAGSASSVETLKAILMANGDELIWAYDDTLQGAGSGGSDYDVIIIAMPEVDVPAGPANLNTNVFGGITPNNPACLLQYSDMAAPKEITSPLPGGATDVIAEWRITPGTAPRPQALTILTVPYQ